MMRRVYLICATICYDDDQDNNGESSLTLETERSGLRIDVAAPPRAADAFRRNPHG